jgi:DNA-binding MarR family transcriptional regulator
MAPLISALTARGYIDKAPVDGRSFALTLTEAGEAERAQVEFIMDMHERRFEKLLDGQDQKALRAALAAIAAVGAERAI